jgi:hypothetical protein
LLPSMPGYTTVVCGIHYRSCNIDLMREERKRKVKISASLSFSRS